MWGAIKKAATPGKKHKKSSGSRSPSPASVTPSPVPKTPKTPSKKNVHAPAGILKTPSLRGGRSVGLAPPSAGADAKTIKSKTIRPSPQAIRLQGEIPGLSETTGAQRHVIYIDGPIVVDSYDKKGWSKDEDDDAFEPGIVAVGATLGMRKKQIDTAYRAIKDHYAGSGQKTAKLLRILKELDKGQSSQGKADEPEDDSSNRSVTPEPQTQSLTSAMLDAKTPNVSNVVKPHKKKKKKKEGSSTPYTTPMQAPSRRPISGRLALTREPSVQGRLTREPSSRGRRMPVTSLHGPRRGVARTASGPL